MRLIVICSSISLLFFFLTFSKNWDLREGRYVVGKSPSLKAATTNNGKILLPIKVLGAQGTIKERVFDIAPATLNATDRLWFMVNNLGYENKGSIRVNEGTWLTLNHNRVTMETPEIAKKIIYPNPTEGALNISRKSGDRVIAAEIYDRNGQLVFKKFTNDGLPDTIEIDFLATGVYLVRLIGRFGDRQDMFVKVIMK